MIRSGVRILLPLAAAAALSAPQAGFAQAWRGDYGYGDYGYGYDAGPPAARHDRSYEPTPPPAYGREEYARGYDAPPPGPGWYGAGYGSRIARAAPRRYRCDRGTGGTILGAIAGGLLGNGIAGRGDRGVGTILGAGVGALAGRAIDRNC